MLAPLIGALLGVWAAAATPILLQTVRVPMRDGVRLAANVFRLSNVNRGPVLLVRTPYGKGRDLTLNYHDLAEAGYVVMVQDVRGRYESEGVFDPLRQEGPDGDDTLRWIARQKWSNGRIGMMGGSYLGIAQWKAALTGNPNLRAIFPVVAGSDDYLDRFYSTGGAMKLGHRLLWMATNLRQPGFRPDFTQFVRRLPLRDADGGATGRRIPMYREAIAHPAYDAYWKSLSTREKLDKIKVPVYIVGGWYDNFVQSDLDAFAALHRRGAIAHAMIGPWPHNMSIPFAGMDFGPHATVPVVAMMRNWFDQWVKGEPARETPPPLRIFVMGRNEWRSEAEWPIPRAEPTPFYLWRRSGSNSLSGDGVLRRKSPGREREDHFSYDPVNPAPTRGGSVCCNPKIFPWGPMDQRPVEQRPDVLLYTSAPLSDDLEVTGPVSVVLYVSTTAKDTDFTAKLVDVHPDGKAINLTDGILRLRYREGLSRPKLAEPGKEYEIRIDAGVTSNVFLAGHRIRLEISSSNFPRFDRNLNTGGVHGQETKGLRAEQTVYLGGDHLSHLVLPVVHKSVKGVN